MGRRQPTITDREYWPAILKRLDAMAQEGVARWTAAKQISKEYKCGDVTVHSAMQRGDVPSYLSKDRARARAWQEGRARYIRGLHCAKCEQRVFYTADDRCINCFKAWTKKNRQEQIDQLNAAQSTGDFYTGHGQFAEDRTLFEPREAQKPFRRGTKIHANVPVDEMARVLKRCRSTIFRELKRNHFSDESMPKHDGYYGAAAN